MTSLVLKKNGKKATIVSFVGGITLFLLYYFTGSNNFIIGGTAWTLVAGLLNLVIIALVLVRAVKVREQARNLLQTASLMLLNIPAALLLLWLGVELATTMRVTIVNSTGKDITEVKIDGCETRHFGIIKSGESQTVWIKPKGDCAVIMTYKQGTIHKSEAVVHYLSKGMGGKAVHIVGTNDISST
jgi:hypothetical protein